MRDHLCKEDKLNSTIEFHIEEIPEGMGKIASLQEDIKNGVQRYPRKNEDIISDTRLRTFQLIYELIKAQYSLGLGCDVLEKYYTQGVELLQYVGLDRIGYVNALQYFSLGILLETPKDTLSQLVELADKYALDDLLFDFLVKSCRLSRNIRSTGFKKEKPYSETEEIINAAMKDREAASLKLADYVTQKWLKGHADYEWTKAHKWQSYVGLWSFESAVIAKIFNLDDSGLKDDNHYPYDLAHYKNAMTFDKTIGLNREELSDNARNDKSIPAAPELEQIIPNEFRDEINQLLVDLSSLEDEAFWEKYDLVELWDTADDYRNDKAGKQIIGSIVIDRLVSLGYILQLDHKEDIEDHVDNMKNYWNGGEVRLVRFESDNDQNYYAKVPVSCGLKNVYEVKIHKC